MEEKYTIQYRIYKTDENEGIYVFMANSNFREGDLWSGLNCTTPMYWIAYTKKLEDFKNLIGNKPTVCAFISNMNREHNREKIAKLLTIHSFDEVKLMLELIDEFVKATVIQDYLVLCT